jgi:4-hydroxythreonine-4-phosphate dehydrogenase
MKPRISMTLGDPSGVGPEIVAKLLADPATLDAADVHLVGSREEFLRAQRIAGVEVPFTASAAVEDADFDAGLPVLQHIAGAPGGFAHGAVSAEAGRYCLEAVGLAVDTAAAGGTDAVCFAPMNKAALAAGGNPYADELHWFAERLGYEGYACEINVLGDLWSSRVTSHVALKDVAAVITQERIVDAVVLIDRVMREAAIAEPRVAVCGLNPHSGDGGLIGREEIEVIEPAIEQARRHVGRVDGPFPADTIFLKVRDGHYDAVVTMYHDQGQIAMKLMGFDRGVSIQGGLPVPIVTPAHGTAFEIAGRGVANASAMREAFELACRMGRQRAATHGAHSC